MANDQCSIWSFTTDRNMEAPYSASLGATGSLIKELDKIASTGEHGTQQLRYDIGIIRDRLDKLSMIQDPPPMVNFWMKEARELSYNIENCVVQFGPTSHSDASMAWISQCSEFKDLVKETIDRYERPNLDQLFHDAWVKPKEGRWQPKAVSILGVQGIGKSTLAKKLWRESDGRFQCRAFVQTAKKPNTRMILGSILSQVRPEQPLARVCKVTDLIEDLTKHLEDKRYFVVIDDLWSISVWDIIRRAFPKGTCGSRIITTTTADDVAKACSSYDKSYVVPMKPLGDDESKKLFVDRIFGSEEKCPLHLNAVSYEIIKKCGGLPLAIICIGTLVAQPKTEQQMDNVKDIEQQLDYVKNFLSNNKGTNSTSMEILNRVLKLCYSSLPHDLKTCLLYLSVYPENYVIMKEDLVTQWIAEGFICITDGKDIEEVAKIYFDELVSLGLIQRMDISNYKKKRLSYTVHPMVFDFITFRSMEDNFITIIDYSQSTVVLTDKIRRLALHFGSAMYATTPAGIGLLQVRSFAFMGLLSCMPSLVEFKLVRVMILHLQDDVGKFSLEEIKELLLLRYLQVTCSVTVTLPDKVECLKHLETLEIYAVVAAAPSDIVNHPSLLHVFLGSKTKHKHLALDPVTSGEAKAIFPDDLSSTSALSPCVQVFKLLPPIVSFSRIPGWIKQLSGLRVLEVMVGELSVHARSLLGLLPALTDLSLHVRKPTASWRVVTKGYFPVLNYLKIVCGVISLSFWEGAVSNLRRLKIGFNARRGDKDRKIVSGIQHLLKLEAIVASIGTATGAEESDRSAAVSALENAIGNHPCRSSFEVKKVGQIYEEYDPPSEIQSYTQSEIQSYTQSEIQPYTESEIQPYTEKKLGQIYKEYDPPSEIQPYALSEIQPYTGEIQPYALSEIQPYTGESTSTPPPPGDLESAAWKTPRMEIWTRHWPERDGQTYIKLDYFSSMVEALQGKFGALLERKHELLSVVRYDFEKLHRMCSSMCAETIVVVRDEFRILRYIYELVHAIEDRVDLFTTRVDGGNGKSTFYSGFLRVLRRLVIAKDNITTTHVIAKDLENLRSRVLDLRAHLGWLRRMREVPIEPLLEERDFVDTRTLVGLDGPTEEVAKMVMDTSDTTDPYIVSIVGMAGAGKTVLASAVYHRLAARNIFQYRAFLSIGPKRDMVRRIMDLMMLLEPNYGHRTAEDVDLLTMRVREILRKKRYLIVIDDLWSNDQWEVIKHCFPDNNLGSRIITTTRNDSLAKYCCSGLKERVHEVSLLSDADAIKLFAHKAFINEQDIPKDLEDVCAKIIRRCGGLPLALVTVAAFLAHKRPIDEWETLGLNFIYSSDSYELKQTLNLSFEDLPPHVKTFMLYLSIFPEDYEIDVVRLLRLWIAEGLITKIGSRSVEEIAQDYLNEIIIRNMVQPLRLKHDSIPRYCKVHPVIHDFIVEKSKDQNFVTIVKSQHGYPTEYSSFRRLSLQSIRQEGRVPIDFSHAHSIIVFGEVSTEPRLTDLSMVRVLDFEGCEGPICLDGLCKLLLLRYLNLRGTSVSELPEDIGELTNLQTLDVRSTNVKKLPPNILKLKRLIHLLSGSAQFPSKIVKMKALQTMSCAIERNDRSKIIIQQLGELANLRDLELICDHTEMSGDGNKQVKFPVDGFQDLRQLCIQGSSPSVTFEPGVLPMVENLELKFKRCITEESGGIFGIENLLSLKHVLLEFSQHDASAMAMVKVVREAASAAHPNHPQVTVMVDERVDENVLKVHGKYLTGSMVGGSLVAGSTVNRSARAL